MRSPFHFYSAFLNQARRQYPKTIEAFEMITHLFYYTSIFLTLDFLQQK